MNVKDIVNRLRLHKKDITEIFITITNQKKDGELDNGWCLVEFMLSLDCHGSVLYRNACELEQASKDFNPQAYYVHLHSNKQSLFILEPGKLEFLEKSKNEFVEWLILPEKVEFSSQTSKLKYTVKPESCFKKYEYEKFATVYEGVNTLTNPPHHLQRYTEICSKNNRDMMVYVNNKPPKDGSIKFYCAMKSEQLLFILKFKMKICESRIIPPNSYHTTAAASRMANALDTSMSNNMHPSSSNYIPAIRGSMNSMEIEVKSSYQQAPSPMDFPNSNSSPNFFISNPNERESTTVSNKHKRKNEFQISQDYELKRTKKTNNTNMIDEEDEGPPIKINLDKRKSNNPTHRAQTYTPSESNDDGNSVEILTSKEAFNKANNSRNIKYEGIQREQSHSNQHSYINQYQYKKQQPQQPIIEKKQEPPQYPRYSEKSVDSHPSHNSHQPRTLIKAGQSEMGDSMPKYENRHASTMSTDFGRSIFDAGMKGNNAFGLQQRGRDTMRKPIINPEQSERINQNFSKTLKDSLKDMKL